MRPESEFGGNPVTYRLVALDMDGTLLTDSMEITPRTANAIRSGMERGVRFVLATARPFCSARPFAEALGLETPLVCCNGALVYDGLGKVLDARPIASDAAAEMASFCQERGLYMKVYDGGVFYVQEPTQETLKYSPRYGIPYEAVGDMASFIAKKALSPCAFVVHAKPGEIPSLKAEMERLWAGRAVGDCPNDHAIHFTDARASKLAAIQSIAGEWGIPREEVLAVGNGGNDREMILWAGFGVAMANSVDGLRELADHVAASNNEEGVAEVLERHLP